MKILTLNTWQERGPWQERWEVVFEGLRKFRPDIAGFQELFDRSWAEEVGKRIGLSNLVFPKEYCGLVIFSRYPVLDWGIVQLSSSPLEEYLRHVLWAKLKVGDDQLVIFNTHLSWQLEDSATRQKQVSEVLQLVRKKASVKEALIMGDLNAPPNSSEIRWFLQEGNLKDLFYKMHADEPGYSWDNRNIYAGGAQHKLPDRRIDYILAYHSGPLLKNLISCDLVLTEPNAQGIWASDHFGMSAEFKSE